MEEKILENIRDILKLEKNFLLTDDMKPGDIIEWDSIAHMMLIVELEKRLRVKFDYEDIIEMDSVGNIVKTILEKYNK